MKASEAFNNFFFVAPCMKIIALCVPKKRYTSIIAYIVIVKRGRADMWEQEIICKVNINQFEWMWSKSSSLEWKIPFGAFIALKLYCANARQKEIWDVGEENMFVCRKEIFLPNLIFKHEKRIFPNANQWGFYFVIFLLLVFRSFDNDDDDETQYEEKIGFYLIKKYKKLPFWAFIWKNEKII